MKLYHYALFFALICFGFFVTAYITLRFRIQEESGRRTEYDCLVDAVEAAVDAAFTNGDCSVEVADLKQAEDAFFRTLEVLWSGTTDRSVRENWKKRIPCIVVFFKDGYYRYCLKNDMGYGWSELIPYEEEEIPGRFFEETEELLKQYHDVEYTSALEYRVVRSDGGIWEQEISPPCVFAVYAPMHSGILKDGNGFLYAASKYRPTAYYVTEDNLCHLPFCEEYQKGKAIGCYVTQKESAEAGASPCGRCLR